MAISPDVENPFCGYFVTQEFEEVILFCTNLLRRLNRSLIFTLHSSAIFERDGNQQELHLPIMHPVILDPQYPDEFITEILENQMHLAQEADLFDNIEGSGWSFVPGTIRYWFKIYPCQPNPAAAPNQNNVSDIDDDDDDADDIREERRNYNYLLYAIMEYFARKDGYTIPRKKSLKFEGLEKYCEEAGFDFTLGDFETEFQLQDLPEWQNEIKAFNIRVFSMRGNVLYSKRFSESHEMIDLYLNSSNKFALVLDLNKLFKRGSDRIFCDKCLQWGRSTHHCEKRLTSSDTDSVQIANIPFGRHGLVGYADFESIIKDNGSHEISGWGALFIKQNGDVLDVQNVNYYETNNVIKSFVLYISEICENYATVECEETASCQICDEPISPTEDLIIGKNFLNGKCGSHHLDCWNIDKNSLYIFFHNFRGYDSHFIMKYLVENTTILNMQATSMEKFNLVRFQCVGNENLTITFKDTFNFFTCSLAKCVSMVQTWRYTPNDFRNNKGVFPYDWFDNFEKLKEKSLPSPPWFNKLTNQEINHEEAFKIWEKMKFTRFSQYHDLYMIIDVYQLADVFEEFRQVCIAEFDIDPVHFQGAPGLTWYLGVCQNPELFKVIKDKDVYMDIQLQIRGGISQAMTRYCNVENKPNESMFFLDVNSLYSKCMTYKMPGKYLYKLDKLPKNWEHLFNASSKNTALLVVDLIYPEHLHDRDWAYPLAPHKYNERLCTTFKRKENYMIHAELLKFYLDRGMILEKFHYLYVFEQDYSLRDYVQGNIEKRRATKNEVMKTLYKLLNNSLYGKTCENVNKYRKFDIVHDESLINDDLNCPVNKTLKNCQNMILFGENFLVEKKIQTVKLNKPIQIGFTILEFAKREIYNFLAIISDNFGDDVIPLYTDTDSVLLHCKFPEPWKKLYNSPLKPYLDFEKVPWDEPKTKDTDKQSGLWSVEADGKEIVEYCGLRAKCYCYRFKDNEIVIKNKGIPKSSMITTGDDTPREKITIEHFKNALFYGATYHISQYAIRSNRHDVTTKLQYKLGLNANDLKRAVTSNRITSLPFGYKGEKFAHLVTDKDDPDLFDQ